MSSTVGHADHCTGSDHSLWDKIYVLIWKKHAAHTLHWKPLITSTLFLTWFLITSYITSYITSHSGAPDVKPNDAVLELNLDMDQKSATRPLGVCT